MQQVATGTEHCTEAGHNIETFQSHKTYELVSSMHEISVPVECVVSYK